MRDYFQLPIKFVMNITDVRCPTRSYPSAHM